MTLKYINHLKTKLQFGTSHKFKISNLNTIFLRKHHINRLIVIIIDINRPTSQLRSNLMSAVK